MIKVLIVDDCPITREFIKKILNRLNINRVNEAGNGEEALSLYDEYKPDLVFMDITMPKLNGIEAMKKLNEKYAHTNIIMVTSLEDQGLIFEALSSGAKGFLVKPIDTFKLKREITKIVSFIQ